MSSNSFYTTAGGTAEHAIATHFHRATPKTNTSLDPTQKLAVNLLENLRRITPNPNWLPPSFEIWIRTRPCSRAFVKLIGNLAGQFGRDVNGVGSRSSSEQTSRFLWRPKKCSRPHNGNCMLDKWQADTFCFIAGLCQQLAAWSSGMILA